MPDSGFQTIKTQLSVRLDPSHKPADTSEQEGIESPSEESSQTIWLLTGSMAFAFLLGMVLWVAIIERIWGGFF